MLDHPQHGTQGALRARTLRVALALLLLGSCLLAGSARAQLIEAWSLDTGFDPRPQLPKARLESMGGMLVSVPDENNEINLLDFGGNLVGSIDDKPTHHLDAWGGWRGWVDRTTPEAPDQDFRYFPTGFIVNAIPNPDYAIGGSASFRPGSAERLVSTEFQRLFGLPIVNPETGSNLGSPLAADLSSGDFTAYYARRMTDRFAFGLLGGYSTEEEKRTAEATYKLNHNSDVWSAQASLAGELFSAAGPFEEWVLGANGFAANVGIDGRSSDDLHTDIYSWERINYGTNIHLLGRVAGWVNGGLDFRYGSFEGQETADYNWSTLFALNPTNQTIRFARKVFEEGLRTKGFATRWEAEPPDLPASFGLGFQAAQTEYWLLPGTNVNSHTTARSQEVTAWEGVAGGSYYLPAGRGLVAGEVVWGWRDLYESISYPRRNVGASNFEIGVGGEYAVALPVVARAGYRFISSDDDRNRENPEGQFSTHRLALGAGYRTLSGAVLLDLAFSYDWASSDAEGRGAGSEVVLDQDRKLVTLQVRTLIF